VLRKSNGDVIFFSGETLYAGPDMGTVEAALASGQETAQTILIGSTSSSSPVAPSAAPSACTKADRIVYGQLRDEDRSC
jgi:hypothetical protein